MTSSEFKNYLEHAVKDYAQDHITAGTWEPSEALKKSREAFQKLLPDGVASQNQPLFTVKDEKTDEQVGIIWFAARTETKPPSAFIYDFVIFEQHRRKGYGYHTLRALEDEIKKLGLEVVSLHVFGHNKGALTLYQKLGFEMTSIQMTKQLRS